MQSKFEIPHWLVPEHLTNTLVWRGHHLMNGSTEDHESLESYIALLYDTGVIASARKTSQAFIKNGLPENKATQFFRQLKPLVLDTLSRNFYLYSVSDTWGSPENWEQRLDLVHQAFTRVLTAPSDTKVIATSCPAFDQLCEHTAFGEHCLHSERGDLVSLTSLCVWLKKVDPTLASVEVWYKKYTPTDAGNELDRCAVEIKEKILGVNALPIQVTTTIGNVRAAIIKKYQMTNVTYP